MAIKYEIVFKKMLSFTTNKVRTRQYRKPLKVHICKLMTIQNRQIYFTNLQTRDTITSILKFLTLLYS